MVATVIIGILVTFSVAGCKTAAAGETTAAASGETTAAAAGETTAAAETTANVVAEERPTFYWICHGSEGVPIFTIASNAAKETAKELNVNVNVSFHHNDAASQKEAFGSAIAAGADGIASTNPAIGVLREEVALAQEKGIPVITINTLDPSAPADGYVGSDLYKLGQEWANYLVDNNFVKAGDLVWLPVEVPGATYETEESRGIKSVFEPLGIKTDLFDAGYDPSECLSNMVDYLTANHTKIKAEIAMGDICAAQTRKAFDQAGVKPGEIPVVGWGNDLETANAVKAGYINAATWQFPEALGYQAVFMLYQAWKGYPINYNIFTQYLFTQKDVDKYIDLLTRLSQ